MGAVYSDCNQQMTTDAATHISDNQQPDYQIFEASCTYDCTLTEWINLPPMHSQPTENLYKQGLAHFDEGSISEAIL